MTIRDPWLAAILLLAAVLRLIGLGHSLPFIYNPDEANIMARGLSIAQDPNPHYFLYPSFFFYLLFGVMGGLFVLGRLMGWYENLGAFEARFFENPTDFYLAGRLIGVLSALLTIVLTYHLAAKHFGRNVARAASLFLAVAYYHVRDAHYLKHDVPVGLLVIVAFVAFDRAMERKTTGSYLLAGLAMGIAFATHYYAIFLAPVFVICHWVAVGLKDIKKIVLAGVASAVTFFLLSPFVLLDLPVALDHMRENRQVVMDRSLDAGTAFFPSLPAYAMFLAEQGLGYVLLGLTVIGFILLVRRERVKLVIWGAFPVFFLILISYTFFAGRYLNPMAPSLAVAGGLAIGAIHGRWGKTAATAVALVACLQPLYFDIQIDRLFSKKDTRTLAREWMLENVPDETRVTLQSYSVPLPQSLESLRESLDRNGALEELDRRGRFSNMASVAERSHLAFRLLFVGRGDEKNRIYFDYKDVIDDDLASLRSQGVTHVVLRHPPDRPPPEVAAFFDEVRSQGKLLERFSPFHDEDPSLHPYMDNEDWPASRRLTHKGPLTEVWLLEE
jgi:hypothetical protein